MTHICIIIIYHYYTVYIWLAISALSRSSNFISDLSFYLIAFSRKQLNAEDRSSFLVLALGDLGQVLQFFVGLEVLKQQLTVSGWEQAVKQAM